MQKRWHIPAAKIIEYIKRNHAFKTRRDGEEYVICNPLNGDAGFHFNINPKKGVCHDWRGDDSWAGPVNPKTGKRNVSFLNFIRLYKKCSFQEAYRLVSGNLVSMVEDDTQTAAIIESDITLPPGSCPIADDNPLAIAIILWLSRRGYTQEDIEAQNLHYYGNDVVWPYYEFGEMVYWQSRSFINKTFRFPDRNIYKDGSIIGISDVSKGDFLYGFDEIPSLGKCYITESIFDKNSIGPSAVASGGAALTDNQCRKLRMANPAEVVLAPDNDKAGIESIVINYSKLRSYFQTVKYVLPPTKCNGKDIKDWNELITGANLGRNEIREYIDKNTKVLDEKSMIRLKVMCR